MTWPPNSRRSVSVGDGFADDDPFPLSRERLTEGVVEDLEAEEWRASGRGVEPVEGHEASWRRPPDQTSGPLDRAGDRAQSYAAQENRSASPPPEENGRPVKAPRVLGKLLPEGELVFLPTVRVPPLPG